MYMGIEQFESYDAKRAGALRDYYAFARDNDRCLRTSSSIIEQLCSPQ
jgi:hypothetical protein